MKFEDEQDLTPASDAETPAEETPSEGTADESNADA